MTSLLSIYDFIVLVFYFVFLVMTGVFARKFISNTSDYFRGGGQMLWWMVGSSAFLVQFSAWTFTGAAGEAYLNGPIVIVIFLGNALGFLVNYLYFAPKFRQMRVITAMQAVKQRFGVSGEQFFTWIQVPLNLFYAGVWLVGLSIFVSSIFDFPLEIIIICVGMTVMINSAMGGSWAVSSSDFIQMLILMMVAIVMTYYSLAEVGGISMMIDQFPVDSILGENYNYPAVIVVWAVAMLMSQLFKTNHMLDASRYLNAKNSDQARKAALLSSILFFICPILWFIPPIVARILIPDIGAVFPQLNNPAEAAYVAVAINVLPHGMVGLLLTGMFAATMSTMDSALNNSSGIFVKNIYIRLLKPNSSEAKQLAVAKISTIFFGILIILIALLYSTFKNMALFDLMITIGSLIGLPMAIPLILGLLIKKTPEWSGWSSTVVGLICSAAVRFYFDAQWFAHIFDLEMLSRDIRYWNITAIVLVNLTIPVFWFLITMKFYKEPIGERQTELEKFWENQNTPVQNKDEGNDEQQYSLIGGLALVYGAFVACMCLIPNPIEGRLVFLLCGLVLVFCGYLLFRKGGLAFWQKIKK